MTYRVDGTRYNIYTSLSAPFFNLFVSPTPTVSLDAAYLEPDTEEVKVGGPDNATGT